MGPRQLVRDAPLVCEVRVRGLERRELFGVGERCGEIEQALSRRRNEAQEVRQARLRAPVEPASDRVAVAPDFARELQPRQGTRELLEPVSQRTSRSGRTDALRRAGSE